MKTRSLKVSLVASLVFALLVCFVSCTADYNDTKVLTDESVVIEINGPEGEISTGAVNISEDDSAYDVTIRYFEDNDITYSESTFGDFSYISEIAGYKEGDYGSMSGWLYSVNNESPDVGCGEYKVGADDVITWTYSTGE